MPESITRASEPGSSKSLWKINNPTGDQGLIGIDKVGDKIRFFDPENFEETEVLDIKNHHEVAISPDHRFAYVTDFGKFVHNQFVEKGHGITILDLVSRTPAGSIETGGYLGPHGMRFDAGGRLWVIFEETGELGVVDLGTNTLAEVYDVGAGDRRPPFIELVPEQNKIYVSSKLGDIIVFDTDRRRVLCEIDVPHGTEGITLSPDGRRLVVAENSKQALLVIDTATDKIVETIALKGAVMSSPNRSRLVRVRFSNDGKYLVSNNYVSGVIHIHDGERPAEHMVLPVAKGPQGMAFTEDNQRVVISNHDCGVATVIDLDDRKAVGCFEFGMGIETLAFF